MHAPTLRCTHSYSSPYRHNYIKNSSDDMSICIRVASIDAFNAGYWWFGRNNVICLQVQYAHGMANFLLLPVSSHETLLMHREIGDLGKRDVQEAQYSKLNTVYTCLADLQSNE